MLYIRFLGRYRKRHQRIQEVYNLIQLAYTQMIMYSGEAQYSVRIGRNFTQMQERLI